MFDKTLVGVALAIFLWQCKLTMPSSVQSLHSADDGVKISAVYVGEKRCRAYLAELGKSEQEIAQVVAAHQHYASHLLDGKNGELISKEFKTARRKPRAQLSGDRFLGRRSAEKFALEDIEAHCRRLLLSIDARERPSLRFVGGALAANQEQLFARDFDDSRFGTRHCEAGLCTFSNIGVTSKAIAAGKRYFAFIEPSADAADISMQIGYCAVDDSTCYRGDLVTLENIFFQDAGRYQRASSAIEQWQDLHGSYVRDLYISLQGGNNLQHQLGQKRTVRVSLQTTDRSKVLSAKKTIQMHSHDPRQKTVSLSIAAICERFEFIAADCGMLHKQFKPALLAQKLQLVFAFYGDRGSLRSVNEVPVDQVLLDKLLNRTGTINISTAAGWSATFAFHVNSSEYLWTYIEMPGKDYRRDYFRYMLISAGYDCALDYRLDLGNFRGGIIGDKKFVLIKSKKSHLINYFRKQRCLQDLGRGKSDRQFFKDLAPTLLLRNFPRNFTPHRHQTITEFVHKMSGQDIDNWFNAKGGIVATRRAKQNGSLGQLHIGWQDRR